MREPIWCCSNSEVVTPRVSIKVLLKVVRTQRLTLLEPNPVLLLCGRCCHLQKLERVVCYVLPFCVPPLVWFQLPLYFAIKSQLHKTQVVGSHSPHRALRDDALLAAIDLLSMATGHLLAHLPTTKECSLELCLLGRA